MSFENPTRLHIGMHGNFGGKDYRVIGRVVMGETEGGETYYWNEFNLEATDGTSADLVFEETERGGEWRLFTMFEPEYPMTAADAATKSVGDRLNLTGEDVRVTLRSTSRVYYIEGEAPEGIREGAVANYFNAEAGDTMQVVSWTGEEVEFYNGVNLARGVVAMAFNLPQESSESGSGRTFSSFGGSASGNSGGGIKFALHAVFFIFLFIIIFGRNLSCSTDYEAAPVKKILASTSPLTVGATGKLNDKNYHITAHAVVEIAETGLIYERNEYQLTDDDGSVALLICGAKPDGKDWILFSPLTPSLPPTPQEAGGKKTGDIVNLDGTIAIVGEIFRSTISHLESVASTDWRMGEVRYGFNAESTDAPWLVHWDNYSISFHHGKNVSAKDTAAAFSVPNGK